MKITSEDGPPGTMRDAVVKHYDSIFHSESKRLSAHSQVEFAITKRYLRKWLKDYSIVADIGVGVGHYAEVVARRNCNIHLVDISARYLDATCSRLEKAGLKDQIISISQTSAVQLGVIPTATCDAVLLLGPLYHLCAIEERQAAVSEAARILKHGGIIFAAGINRLAYFRDLLRENPMLVAKRKRFHKYFLSNGNLDPSNAPLIGFAHLTTVAEFRSVFDGTFEEAAFVGVESFAGPWQKSLFKMPANVRDAWLDVIEQTALTMEGIAASDHFLFIGKKN